MLKGCDISKWQKNTVILQQFDFVIMKATEGKTLVDSYLNVHYNNLHGSTDGKPDDNKLYGFYHYARPEYNTPKEEAEFFLKTVGHHAGHCIFALDWEGVALNYNIKWAIEWLDYVFEKTGVRPLIYCQGSYTKNLKAVLEKNYGLWVAHYKASTPTTGVYPTYAIWQYTSTPFDLDYFNGTEEQFRKYCKKVSGKVNSIVEDKKEELYTFGEAVKMMRTGVEMSVKGSGIIVGIKSATENTNEYMYTYKENKKTPYNATLDDLLSEEWCKVGE